MYKTVVVLPDGRELSSGRPEDNAIESFTLTQSSNDETELSPGAVCSDAIELTVLTGGKDPGIQAGAQLLVYWEDASGKRRQVGIYIAEKPSRISANRLRILAYDRVSLLDRDLTEWLAGLTGWPYGLEEFATMVCQACGVKMYTDSFLNPDFPVQRFSATHVTGRQLMHWACQASCSFCRADPQGELYTSWYRDRDSILTPGGGGYYYQGSLSYEDYDTEPISHVCLRQSAEDVGVSYPESSNGDNPLVIEGNPLLASGDTQQLQSLAQKVYGLMNSTLYTPCKVTIPIRYGMMVGEYFRVTDPSGRTFAALSMSAKCSGQKMAVECTGSIRRNTLTSQNALSYHAMSGKVMKLQTAVDGIRVENRDTAGKMAALEMTVDGMNASVELHERIINERLDPDLVQTVNKLSQLEMTVDGIDLTVSMHDQMINETLSEELSQTVSRVSRLQMEADSITAEVSRQSSSLNAMTRELTQVKQTAQELEVSVQAVQENGTSKVTTSTGYTFGADGLRIQKAGQEMENLLDEKGMTVSRGDEVMLKADKDGVQATDVTVRNYLIVGSHARFEDHSNGTDGKRTACFYI